MKLVPLSRQSCTETVRGRRDYKVRNYFNKCCTGKTTGCRSSSSRTGWSGRRKRSENAGQRRTEGYLF